MDSIQSLIRKTPANIIHMITEKRTVTPNNMIRPSRVLNLDRFMAPLRRQIQNKAGPFFGGPAHTGGGASARSGIQVLR
jgi:hypothetical protein